LGLLVPVAIVIALIFVVAGTVHECVAFDVAVWFLFLSLVFGRCGWFMFAVVYKSANSHMKFTLRKKMKSYCEVNDIKIHAEQNCPIQGNVK
jgi:hypothetical protein